MTFAQLAGEFRIATRNLRRNRRRTLVTGLGLLSGYVGLVLLCGYVLHVERYLMVNSVYLNHTGHIAIYRTGGLDRYFSKPRSYVLSAAELKTLDEALGPWRDQIEFTEPYLMANGLVQNGEKSVPFQAKGVTKDADERVRLHPMVQEWTPELNARNKDLFKAPVQGGTDDPVAITSSINDALGRPSVVQLLGATLDGGFNGIESPVAYLFSTGMAMTEPTGLRGSYAAFQHLLETDGASYVGVFLHRDAVARSLAAEMNRTFKDGDLPFEAVPFFDERIGLFYTGTMNFLSSMAIFFLILVSGVVILTVTNAVSMNIIERVREIGTLRAIGFKSSDIARLLTIESFVLALAFLFLGALIAQVVSWVVAAAQIRVRPPGIAGDVQFIVTPWLSLCLGLGLILMLVTVCTAFVVTRRKMRAKVSTLLTETST